MTAPQVLARSSPSGPLLAAGAEMWVDAILGAGAIADDSTYTGTAALYIETVGAGLVGGATMPVFLPSTPAGFGLQVLDFEITYGAATNAPLGPVQQVLEVFQHDQSVPNPSGVSRGGYSREEAGTTIEGLHIERASDWVAGSTAFPQNLDAQASCAVLWNVQTNTYNAPIWLYRLRILVRSVAL